VELAAEAATVAADPAAVEIHPSENQPSESQSPETQPAQSQPPETPAAVIAVAVNTALFVQEPAPVDTTDEPMFASIASAAEQAPQSKVEEAIGRKPAEAIVQIEKSETAEARAPEEAVAAKGLESEPEESSIQELSVEEVKAESLAQPAAVAESAIETAEEEGPAPSDEELAEALRLLTPATGHAAGSTVPSQGTLVAAGQLLAEEVARNAAAGPRWIAEPVALSPEEAAISLEAEMFRTFAGVPAAMPAVISAATSAGEVDSREIPKFQRLQLRPDWQRQR